MFVFLLLKESSKDETVKSSINTVNYFILETFCIHLNHPNKEPKQKQELVLLWDPTKPVTDVLTLLLLNYYISKIISFIY